MIVWYLLSAHEIIIDSIILVSYLIAFHTRSLSSPFIGEVKIHLTDCSTTQWNAVFSNASKNSSSIVAFVIASDR